jgi:hypothetical protein
MDRVNKKELSICRKRGHGCHLDRDWIQCKHCGMWLREIRTVEERETRPPEDEISEFHRLTDLRSEVEKAKGRKKRSA